MNRNALLLIVGFAAGAAVGAVGMHFASPPAAEDGSSDTRTSRLAEEAAQLRKQVDVLERKLARKTGGPVEAFRQDMNAGGSDAPRGGAALDEAARIVADLMRGLETEWSPPWMLVDDEKSISRFFHRSVTGPTLEGRPDALATRPADGATIRFPAGRHALDAQSLSRFEPFPREIVIEGAGMDSTLLVMNDDLRPRGQVFHLRIRNATVNTNGGRLLRARDETFSLRLDKCRVVGFDAGAGGSVISGGRGVLFASDCRFEAGYGGRPAGLGLILEVNGPVLSRFERCVFLGPFIEPFSPADRCAEVYVGCSFESMPPHVQPLAEEHRETVRIQECRFDYLEERAPPVTRKLTDLNDAW